MVVATAVPLIWLGFGVDLFHQDLTRATRVLLPFIAITGVGHVGATAFFYIDEDFFPLIRQNRARFFLSPLLASTGCLAVYLVSSAAWTLVVAGFLAWQLYHYQRQNYGLIAFAGRSVGCALPAELNRMLNLGVATAVCNMLRRIDLATGIASLALLYFSILLFVASTVILIRLLRSAPALRSPSVFIFTILSWAFFVPTLLSTGELVGFWSYAMAHGAQYVIFMIVVAGRCRHGLVGLAALVLVFAAMYVGFGHLNGSTSGSAFYTGLVMSHFLIDAKIWRLREPLQRDIMRERFAFIFR